MYVCGNDIRANRFAVVDVSSNVPSEIVEAATKKNKKG